MPKPRPEPEEVKRQILQRFDNLGVTSAGDVNQFKYDASKPVKCGFSLVLDHTVWSAFCANAEQLKTSPTYLLFQLMETYLLTVGKLDPDYRSHSPMKPSDPVVVTVEDLKDTPGLDLGENSLVKRAPDPVEESLSKEELVNIFNTDLIFDD